MTAAGKKTKCFAKKTSAIPHRAAILKMEHLTLNGRLNITT
jgi:hypothetical protein